MINGKSEFQIAGIVKHILRSFKKGEGNGFS